MLSYRLHNIVVNNMIILRFIALKHANFIIAAFHPLPTYNFRTYNTDLKCYCDNTNS